MRSSFCKTFVIFCLSFSACSKDVKFIGFPNPDTVKTKIRIGDSKTTVKSILGEPSFIDNNGLTWYYVRIDGFEGSMVSFVPKGRILASIEFNSLDVAEKIDVNTSSVSPAQYNDIDDTKIKNYKPDF